MDKNKEIISAIKLVAQEKNIPQGDVLAAFEEAIKKAYVKEFPEEEIDVKVDMDNGVIEVNKLFKVVEHSEELNEYCEIPIKEAKKIDSKLELDDFYKEKIDIWSLNERRIVTHILQVFKHLVSVETNKILFREWSPKIGTIINAEVEKPDNRPGSWIINLGTTYGSLAKMDAIPDERLIPGTKYNFYVKEVKEQTKDWPVILSRADANLVKHMLITSIPEIQEGMIEIVAIARVAGFKTKVVVKSKQSGIDPIGSCIGPRGSRIKPIISEIGNEKIEFIEWDENSAKLLANTCTPANLYGFKIIQPETEEDRKKVILIADDGQIALLIGPKGRNVRLLSMLLDSNIDIKSIMEAKEEKIEFEKIDFNKYRQSQFARAYDKHITASEFANVTLSSLPNAVKSRSKYINPNFKNNDETIDNGGNSNFNSFAKEEIKKDNLSSFSKLSNEDILATIDKSSNLDDEEVIVVAEDVNIEGLEDSIEEMENLIKDVQTK